jgi:hypothetical protein
MNTTAAHLPIKTIKSLLAGGVGVPYITTISMLANIKSDANGFYSVPVEISGWDIFNDFFAITTTFEVSVIPQLPEFVVVNSMNTKIIPGQNFTLKVTLKNVGWSTANDLEVLFIGSSDYTNTFMPAGDGINTVDSLAAGEQVILTWNATSDANLSIDNDYEVALKFMYTDDLGTIYGFNDNTPASLVIRTSRRELPQIQDTFLLTAVDSPDISAGKTVTLSIDIMNIGEVDINNVNVKLVSNSNLFTITPGTGSGNAVTFNTLLSGAEKTAEFSIKVAKSVEPGVEYELQLFVQYTDDLGQTKNFDSDDSLPVTIRIQEKKVEKEEDHNWELVTVGVLILIAAIIFAMLWGRILKKQAQAITKTEAKPEEEEPELEEEEPEEPEAEPEEEVKEEEKEPAEEETEEDIDKEPTVDKPVSAKPVVAKPASSNVAPTVAKPTSSDATDSDKKSD